MTKLISIFGSSQPKPNSPVYQLGYQLGFQLARAGFTVATGGYNGTMAAVSEGAAEANGTVIGVISGQIERQFNIQPNQWVNQKIYYESLRDRLLHLILNNDGLITLPGGIGTLSEMSTAWSFIQTAELSKRPLILMGDMWPKTINTFMNSEFVRDEYLDMLQFTNEPETAVSYLQTYFDE